MNQKTITEKLVCESCGKEFSCGAKSGKCWCFDINLKPETVAELNENYERCLCEDCLKNRRIYVPKTLKFEKL